MISRYAEKKEPLIKHTCRLIESELISQKFYEL